MQNVLHYKTIYLNKSETFIDRLVRNHQDFVPSVLCYNAKSFTEGLPIYKSPQKGVARLINLSAFHLNLPLPYYTTTIQQLQPHVIHAHFGYDAYKLIGPARKSNVPLVVSFYGSDVSRLPKEFGWKKRYRKLAEEGSHFIAATEFMKEQLENLGFPGKRISIVPFGIDLTKFTFRKSYEQSSQIMMIGRMVEKKGFEYAIKSIANLKRANLDVTLNLFGNGPLKKELQTLASELNLNGNVKFHGYVPMKKIVGNLEKHSILLAPSVTAKDGDKEGLPNTILEAMAKGIPVIASKHAAIPEAVKDNETGFLVDERSPEQISDKITCILKDKEQINNIRIAARRYIEENHSIEGMVTKVESIYNNVK